MENLKGKSMDLTEDNLNKLKELFPEVFEEGKIDFDKLRLLLGDEVDDNEERYEFTWHGKNNAIRIAQTPSTGTLRPDKESSKNWDDTENLYIEGDNLEVLKLLQKSYFGKVKMIYIDPPYNTGKDFVYPDYFRESIPNYKKITNQTTRANPETNGRFHTDWLNMMYPRLKLARNLLSEDGTIFISIDDTEVENLRKVCDEVFGEENFVTEFIWEKKKKPSFLHKNVGKLGEYILCYVKDEHNTFPFSVEVTTENKKYPINNAGNSKSILKFKSGSVKFGIEDSTIKAQDMSEGNIITRLINDVIIKNGVNENEIILEGEWRYSQDKLDSIINKGEELYISKIPFRPNHIKKGGEIKKMKNFLSPTHYNCETNEDATFQIIDLLECNAFDYSKPIKLMKLLIKAISYNDVECTILDFFSGSSTTAHAVMQLNTEDNGNRKFIMVQLPEQTDEKSEAYKAGYKNICEIGKERIRRAGDKIVSENKDKEGIENLDIGFKVFKLDSSNLKSWDYSMDNLEQNLLDMESNLKKDRTNEDLLYEILLKSGIELTAKIEEIKVGYNTLYNIGCGALLVCLDDKITQDVIDEIPKHKSPFMDTKVIFKEAGFMSDAAKINAVQNLKQFKIEDVSSV